MLYHSYTVLTFFENRLFYATVCLYFGSTNYNIIGRIYLLAYVFMIMYDIFFKKPQEKLKQLKINYFIPE